MYTTGAKDHEVIHFIVLEHEKDKWYDIRERAKPKPMSAVPGRPITGTPAEFGQGSVRPTESLGPPVPPETSIRVERSSASAKPAGQFNVRASTASNDERRDQRHTEASDESLAIVSEAQRLSGTTKSPRRSQSAGNYKSCLMKQITVRIIRLLNSLIYCVQSKFSGLEDTSAGDNDESSCVSDDEGSLWSN